MSKDKVVVLLKDIKESKLLEIQRLLGDKWHDSMLEEVRMVVEPPEKNLADRIKAMIDSLTDKNPDRPVKTRESMEREFKGLSEERKKEIREAGLAVGHDCYNCEDKSCALHPDYVDLESIQYDAKSH